LHNLTLSFEQEQDAAPIDPEDEAVKTRVRQIELLSTPQPTDFSFTLNVLALITLSNFKARDPLHCRHVMQPRHARMILVLKRRLALTRLCCDCAF
jgi:hypothetical protein